MPKFTDLYLNSLKSADKRYEVYDSLLPAFTCRVGKRTKTFLVLTPQGGRITIGHYPALSLAEARQKARDAMTGTKPQVDQFRVSEVITAYLKGIQVRPNTHRFYEQFLKRLEAKHGTKNLDEITPRMCAEMITSPHMHQVFKIFFRWTKGQAYTTTNPMADIQAVGKFKKRKRKLTDEELKAIWKAADPKTNYGATVRLIILLAARRSEIGTAKVNSRPISTELTTFSAQKKDHLTDTVTFPATKNGVDHVLPITPYMRELFTHVKPLNNWSKLKLELDKDSGVYDWVLHDARRTTATNLCRPEINTDPFIVERILNHSLPNLMQIYNQTDWTETMREPLEKHEKWLLGMVKS